MLGHLQPVYFVSHYLPESLDGSGGYQHPADTLRASSTMYLDHEGHGRAAGWVDWSRVVIDVDSRTLVNQRKSTSTARPCKPKTCLGTREVLFDRFERLACSACDTSIFTGQLRAFCAHLQSALLPEAGTRTGLAMPL